MLVSRRFIIRAASLSLVALLCSCGGGASGVIAFPDPNLEATVREAITVPEGSIYPSDLDGLTSVDASEKNSADLTGLEHCTDLTELQLANNQMSDIESLANNLGLSEGGMVNLSNNPLSDTSINTYIPQLEARGVIVDY